MDLQFPIAMVRNKEQMEVLEPGRGKTFTAYDGDTWKAVKFPGGRSVGLLHTESDLRSCLLVAERS